MFKPFDRRPGSRFPSVAAVDKDAGEFGFTEGFGCEPRMGLVDLHHVITSLGAFLDDDPAEPAGKLEKLMKVMVGDPPRPAAGPNVIDLMAQTAQG